VHGLTVSLFPGPRKTGSVRCMPPEEQNQADAPAAPEASPPANAEIDLASRATEAEGQRAIIKAILGSGAPGDPNAGLVAQMDPVSGDAPPDAPAPVQAADTSSPPPTPPPPAPPPPSDG
jgi:hypothetical protein